VKQTTCFVSSVSSAVDDGDDDGDILDAMKQIVSERAKLKDKVQVSIVFTAMSRRIFVENVSYDRTVNRCRNNKRHNTFGYLQFTTQVLGSLCLG